jgi:hypothetical protein
LLLGELGAEGGDFGLGGGAGFAFTLDDFDGAEDFLSAWNSSAVMPGLMVDVLILLSIDV